MSDKWSPFPSAVRQDLRHHAHMLRVMAKMVDRWVEQLDDEQIVKLGVAFNCPPQPDESK